MSPPTAHHVRCLAIGAVGAGLAMTCSASDGRDVGRENGRVGATALKAARQADRDVSAMAGTHGLYAAFLSYFDVKESRILEPVASVRGSDNLSATFDKGEPDVRVDLSPESGRGAASGKLAVITGPYVMSSRSRGIEQDRSVMVWGGDADANMKVGMIISLADPGRGGSAPDPEGRPGPAALARQRIQFSTGPRSRKGPSRSQGE